MALFPKRDPKDRGLATLCAKLGGLMNIRLPDHLRQTVQRMIDEGKIKVDSQLIAGDHPEFDQAVFENQEYIHKLRECFKEVSEMYQEFERRLDTYQNQKNNF